MSEYDIYPNDNRMPVKPNIDGRVSYLEDRMGLTEATVADNGALIFAHDFATPADIKTNSTYIGGEYPRLSSLPEKSLGRASQGVTYDRHDNSYYVLGGRTDGVGLLYHFHWGEFEEGRTLIKNVVAGYGIFPHQGIALYRPNADDPVRFFCGNDTYLNSSTTDGTQTRVLNLVEYDPVNNSVRKVRSWQLLGDESYSDLQLNVSVSADSKKLIARTKRVDDEVYYFLVFDIATLLSMDEANLANAVGKYEHAVKSPYGKKNVSGQSVVSDGKFIYMLESASTTKTHTIRCCDFYGNHIFERFHTTEGAELYDGYKVIPEGEALFFAPVQGKMELILNVSLSVYDKGNDTSYNRYSTYYVISSKNNRDGLFKYEDYQGVDNFNFNNFTEPGVYAFRFDNADCNAPNSSWANCVLTVVSGVEDTKQTAWRLGTINTNDSEIYVRSGRSGTWGAWHQLIVREANGGVACTPIIQKTGSNSFIVDPNGSVRLRTENTSSSTYFFTPKNFYLAKDTSTDGSTSYSSLVVRSADVIPFAKGAYTTLSLGHSSYKWSQVFAATAEINTSDAREKTSITDPNEALMRAWGKVNFKAFQFADAVEKKGEAARVHFGVIAQQVAEAFASEGLDASRYALFCYDKWEDEYEDVEVVDVEAVLDEDGNEVTPAVTHTETRLVTPAGDRYGIRYSEALALECAYQRWRLDQLEAKLNG